MDASLSPRDEKPVAMSGHRTTLLDPIRSPGRDALRRAGGRAGGRAGVTREDQARAYREAMGAEAAERQRELAVKFLPCCGNERVKGHAPNCSKGKRAR